MFVTSKGLELENDGIYRMFLLSEKLQAYLLHYLIA